MELMNQPFTGQLGNRLIELLESPEYHTLNIVVAFAKNSGVLRIKDSLDRFRKHGGVVNAYVGIDLGGTSFEALTALLLHTDSLNVVHSEKWQTFHPKIYHFLGREKELIVVGSHNLTAGGLWTNFESSVLIPIKRSRDGNGQVLSGLDGYIRDLTSLKDSLMSISAQSDIDKLLQHGYVIKEVAEQVLQGRASKQRLTQKRLFGNGFPAKIPGATELKKKGAGLVPSPPATSVSVSWTSEGETIWFESRSMTGGSRNILDLSMRSLIERGDPKGTSFDIGDSTLMRGGVEFFGLDPTDTGRTKDVTVNFEGVDYLGNTILFPTGASANGTWRLQIKGVSSTGQRITEALRLKNEAYYLVRKIITFTRIQDDYYFMSVFPESELDNFKTASRILARNGSTAKAKWLGLL